MMKISFLKIVFTFLLISCFSLAQNKILFDATKAEMAGSADWVIDSDTYNINFTSNGALVLSGGNESNPQRIPTPAQSGITTSTTETYWTGALSAMAVDCVKQGYLVETLPYNGLITYGNSNNIQDLSNYKVFVVDEPNIAFTASEKAAIINFVANGGGLMMVSDHTVSDRNNDGIDSPDIWNDLLTNNTVQANPFGITFDLANISGSSTTVNPLGITSPYYTILHGTYGAPTQVYWSNGTTMTLNTTNNSSVKGIVFKTGASTSGTTNVLAAASTYQNGKVFAVGDSSILDDGTGDQNDTLYNGYTADASGNHQKLLMNAMIWLMTTNTAATNENSFDNYHFTIAPNPTQNKQLQFSFTFDEVQNATITIYDALGRIVKTQPLNQLNIGINYLTIDASPIESGLYTCKLSTEKGSKSLQVVIK